MKSTFGRRCTVVLGLMGLVLCSCAVEERVGASGPAWRRGPAPDFVLAPAAKFEKDGVRIQFWVSRATDVAVLVRNANGKTVRHLVAGMLGPNAPAPLARNSLGQSLIWDGRDDDGRCVPAGRYRVEVNLGLTARYDKSLSWNPRELGIVHGLAVGPNGKLYVMSEVGRDSLDGVFRVFTGDGEYVRTILPRPGSIPLRRARPLGEMVLDDGERFPASLLPQYGSRRYQVPVVTAEGDLIFTNVTRPAGHPEAKRFRSVAWRQRLSRRLLRIAADGGAPKAGYLGPVLGKGFETALLSLAMGPDGLIYISGARHAVFRVKWGENEKPELFVGTPDKPGAGTRSLNGPSGIAFDGQGNLYVADRNNHRIAVFDPDGGFLTRIPLEWPRRLVVHPRTGAIYATSGFRNQHLVKFSHRSEGKPVARCDLRTDWPSIALDGRGSKPILYVGNVKTRDPKLDPRTRVLIRLIDAGDKFTSEKVLSASARPKQPLLYGVDRERELVYGNWPYEGWWRMDGRTGRIETFDTLLAAKANGITEISAGADGTVVVHVRGEIGRLDRHLMPRPFSATGTYTYNFPKEDSLRSYYGRDVTIAPNGDIYWIHERGGYANPMRCSAVNFDGTRKKDSLIVFETGSPAGVRVDRQGCIYVIDHLKPLGRLVPEEMDHKITRRRLDRFVHHYGSLLKFKPTGGKVRLMGTGVPKARQLESGQMQFTAVEGRGDFVVDGALWSYFGVSMIRPARPRSGCQCWTPRFDLDDFARVFVPDELRSRIIVLDTNGNELMTFGRYGNADDHGPGIPLADPRTVMVSREAAYIGDMTNQRVVRAKLSYRRSAGCTVTVPARTLTEVARELREQDRILERRIALRLMNAELRVADLRAEAAKLSPRVKHRLDWDGLVLKVAARASGALANREDAQAGLAGSAPREVRDWREREVDALLGKYLASGGEGLRLAVVWGLWDGRCGKAGEELLLQALKDESQLVRVTAAYVLLDRKNTAGLAHVFQGALSKDSNVYKMAETAILKKVLGAGHSIGKAEVEALGEILRQTRGADRASRTSYWYLRRAVFLMLPLSTDRAGAESALLAELRAGEQLTGNNLNRVIRGLGVVRSVKAIPDLVGFLKRGRNPGWRGGHGDRAESFAATALANIAAPESVAPIIELLDSETAGTAAQSLRALTLMFDPGAPADRRLVPRAGRLEQVRIARLPRPTAIRGAWEEFWKASGAKYERDPDGPPLRVKAGK